MTDFEMDKMYAITGRELLALLSLIPDGTEKAKAILENVTGREKSGKVNESQIDLLPCPFCDSNRVLIARDDHGKYVQCLDCDAQVYHFMEPTNEDKLVKIWNMRYLNGMPISLHNITPRPRDKE